MRNKVRAEARVASLALSVTFGLFGQAETISAKSLRDFAATGENTTTLRLEAGEYTVGNGQCALREASAEVVSARSPAPGGKIWIDDACVLHVDLPVSAGVTVKCTGCVYGPVPTPTVSPRGVLLYDVAVAQGRWTNVIDRRGVLSLWPYAPGDGLQADTPTGRQFSVDSTVARRDGPNVFTSDNDFSTATKTAPFRLGESDPGTCDANSREFFYNTRSNTLKVCNAPNSWASVSGGNASGCARYSKVFTETRTQGTTHDLVLFNLPAMAKITGVTIKHSSTFEGPGINRVTVSVGTRNEPQAYAPEFELTQPAGDLAQLDASGHRSATAAAHDVIARFSSFGANLDAVSGGAVDIWVCAVALQQ